MREPAASHAWRWAHRPIETLATGLCFLLALAACGNAASDARTTVDRQNQLPTPTASAQPTSDLAPTATSPAARNAEAAQGCAAFDSWEWAQTFYDGEPGSHRALDPDGDGVACPHLGEGAAPATWTNQIPPAAEPVSLLDVVDGDTIEARLADGSVELVRLIGVNTPETSGPYRPRECYGDEASEFTRWLLSTGGDLYLERDTTNRDRFDRLLRYAWLDFGGEHVYLVNEAIVRSGYGEMTTYPPDLRYVEYLREAEAFARDFSLGLWQVCGDVGVSLTGQPSTGPGARAVAASSEAGGDDGPLPAVPQPAGAIGVAAGCDGAYPGVCIPPAPPDLDCGDIGLRAFAVRRPDPHRFDQDGDGIGCER